MGTPIVPVPTQYFYTYTQLYIPSSCQYGSVSCPSLSTTSVETLGGAPPYSEATYVGPLPPSECALDCEVVAKSVRILFFPVDDNMP